MHADLQPAHAIHADDGSVQLIDYAWAQGHPVPIAIPFKGTLVHSTAPELAAQIGRGEVAAMTPAAEVYTLAATLWTCATGAWPWDYTAAGIDAKIADIRELWEAIGRHALTRLPGPAWPQLRTVLAHGLATEPADRPTMADLIDELSHLVHRS